MVAVPQTRRFIVQVVERSLLRLEHLGLQEDFRDIIEQLICIVKSGHKFVKFDP